MRIITAEATLKVKNLDEITAAHELVKALRQQCDKHVTIAGRNFSHMESSGNDTRRPWYSYLR